MSMGFDWWDKEWPVITGAPHIVFAGVVVIIGVVFMIVRWGYSREIASKAAEISTLNAHLRLAKDEQTAITNTVAQLTQQLSDLSKQIETHTPLSQLAVTTARVSNTVHELTAANLVLGSTLSPANIGAGYNVAPLTTRSD
jgi:Tfp pilus assembly protein PilO